MTRRVRVLAAVAVLAVLALGGAFAVRRSEGWKEVRLAAREAGWTALRLADPEPDEVVRVETPGEPTLTVHRYLPEGPPEGALVFVHGNRRRGSDEPVYRVLSRSLARAGWDVWAMDLRGFGDSDPAPAGRWTAEDLLGDVRRVMDRLERVRPSGPRAVVGHSLGAIVALQLGPDPPWRVVSLEPGVGLHERVVAPGAGELEAFTAKLRAHVRGGTIDAETVRRLYDRLDPERPRPAPRTRIVQGRRAERDLVEGMHRVQEAQFGSDLAWSDSRNHEYGVGTVGGVLVVPTPVIAEVRDLVLEHVAGGHDVPDATEVETR